MISRVNIAIISAVLVCVAGVFWFTAGRHPEPKITYSQFLASVEAGQVASVTIMSSNSGAFPAVCRLKDGGTVRTVLPAAYGDALRAMQEKLVSVEIRDTSSEPLRLLLNATPFLVLMGFWFFMMRKLRNGPRQGLWG